MINPILGLMDMDALRECEKKQSNLDRIMEPFMKIVNDKKQRIVQIVVLVIFIGFGLYRIIQARILNEINLSYTLEKFASDMNSECPIAVGSSRELVIDKVVFSKKNTIIYHYTYLTHSIDDFDLIRFKENISKAIIEELESMKSLTKLRNRNVFFEYTFSDNLGNELFRFKVLFNNPINIYD